MTGDPVAVPAVPGVTVLGELGRGANAVTYRVRRDGRDWAMKVYAGQPGTGRQSLLDLRREAALLSWVGHPGLTRVHEVGRDGDRAYMIMDLVPGRSLAAALAAGPLGIAESARLASAVAEVLAAVHRVGLVHRDVKPQNIMLEPDGRARLIDFGMVARTERDHGETAAGTFLYAAPEQTGMIKRPVDGRSDLYALGAVLFQCLTGTPPFVAEDTGTLLRLHAVTAAPPLAEHLPDAPEALAGIVARLLAKDPDDRYPSAGDLVADLARMAGAEPVPPEPAAAGDPAAVPAGLIGRDPQWRELCAVWERATAGHGGVALITGGPGTGKTRTAYEFAAAVRRDGGAVLRARCTPDAAPLAVLRSAVEHYLAGGPGNRERRADLVRAAAAATGAAADLGRLSPDLAGLLDTGPVPDGEPVRLSQVIAGFLTELARAHGSALLCLDDLHVADAASQGVLRRLAGRLDDSPLLVLATVPDEAAAGRWLEALPDGPAPAVRLGPLDPSGVHRLVTSCVRGVRADDELVQRLVSRGGVTPFEVVEYIRAVVEAGLLAPHWGGWQLDSDGLDAVTLPDDVLGLMLRRLDGLDPAARATLTVAAAIGPAFRPEILESVGGPAEAVHRAVDEAIGCRVLERRGDLLAFVHEGIRRALLADPDQARLRETHHRIAEAMDHAAGEDPDRVHAVARHYLLGHPDRAPARVAEVCLAAGRSALAHHAPAEAIEFLEAVNRLAGRAPEIAWCEVDELLGAACYQAGRLTEAEQALVRALPGAPTGVDRARVLGRLAELRQAVGDLEESTATVRRALAELGCPLPGNPVRLVASSLMRVAVGAFVERTGLGFGTTDPERQARYRLRARLHGTAAVTAILQLDPLGCVMLTLRSLYPAARLGISAEYARTRCEMGSLLKATGLRSGRSFELAAHAAAQVGEAAVAEHVAWIGRTLPFVLGEADARHTVPAALDRAGLVDTSNYLKMLEGLVFVLLDAGFTDEARQLHEEGTRRVTEADVSEHSVAVWGIAAAAARGRVAEADTLQRRTDEQGPRFSNRSDRQTRLHAAVRAALEQRDFAAFDRAVAGHEELSINPKTMPLYRRSVYSAIAYARVEQCLAAPAAERDAALAAAERAVRDLRRAAMGGRTMTAHHAIVKAYLPHLRGDHDGALAALAAADGTLRSVDAPLVTYEAARLRARALAGLRRRDDALAHAAAAATVADRQGWPHRGQWIRSAFDLGATGGTGPSRTGRGASTGAFSADRQRLEAVERLSVAAARILDPTELTGVALDEVIRLLGAERAYLFLSDDAGRLVPRQGRDATGADLATLTGYGSTLVERVRNSRETLVVTGTDEGVALGSQSVLAHGLRSIMVAPLLLDGRLLGAVYLDSRVAKGMFTEADAGVLAALTTHVATALETARAAELAVAVRSARRERDVAETLRDAMTQLSGTLDPADVLRRLHDLLRHALPAARSWLAVLDGDKLQVWNERDEPVDAAAAGDPALGRLLAAEAPVGGGPDDPPPAPFGAAAGGSWLAVPLRCREEPVGVVVLAAPGPGDLDTRMEIGAALAGQAMTAYENARLFARVEHLATTDGLTGLFNRRHFFALTVRELALARRRSSPLTAVMADIDHFKQINDRYGHPAGDRVIAAIAQRLTAMVRTTDLLARYGGEEFAVVLPDTGEEGAMILAERLRAAAGERPVDTDAGPLTVTISVGVACLEPGDRSVEELLGRADTGLYQAKRDGRDRVALARRAG